MNLVYGAGDVEVKEQGATGSSLAAHWQPAGSRMHRFLNIGRLTPGKRLNFFSFANINGTMDAQTTPVFLRSVTVNQGLE
jgi:hypothetical protein